MPFFAPKPPVSNEEFDWLIACFAWLRNVLQDDAITPPSTVPGDPYLAQAKNAQALFDTVKHLAGMAEWPCRLEKVADDFEMGDIRVVKDGAPPCGTFSVEEGIAVIRYSDAMLRDPDGLTATFAHELCHYLLMNAGDPPGGPELMEHSTDCAAAYLGFGVFLANSARSFEQFNDGEWSGWRSAAMGYLSEQALVTATAIFAVLHNHDEQAIVAVLKPYLQKDFRKAMKAVRHRCADMDAALASVDLADWQYG